jgi:hypothetical protein
MVLHISTLLQTKLNELRLFGLASSATNGLGDVKCTCHFRIPWFNPCVASEIAEICLVAVLWHLIANNTIVLLNGLPVA